MNAPSLPAGALGYLYNGGGISNQKLALLGLFLQAARNGPRRVVLPNFLVFDQVRFDHAPVAFDRVMRVAPLRDFAAHHGIEIVDAPPAGDKGGWDFFHHGRDYLPYAALRGELAPDSFACEFFRALVPVVVESPALRSLADAAFARKGIAAVVALRIEADWARHAASTLVHTAAVAEDNVPTYADILRKVMSSSADLRQGVLIVCDEAALPVPKEAIRRSVKDDSGLDLYWKSDLVDAAELAPLSALELSLLDFEASIAAPQFVGLSRSTFSNLATFEKYARTRAPVAGHYIYNTRGAGIVSRTDNGVQQSAALATARDVHDPALRFECAQVYEAAGDKLNALASYRAAAVRPGAPPEETYSSLYRAARLMAELGFPAAEVVETFLKAADCVPSRAEALHAASRYCRDHGDYRRGYEIGKRAAAIAAPANGLFLEHWVYDYGALDELAVNAYYAGQHLESLEASLIALERGKVPDPERSRIARNAGLALDRLDRALPETMAAALRLSKLESGLASLYAQHTGKASDKWESYFAIYDALLAPVRQAPIALLEIGVQNGGSIEIWAKYLPNATHLVGCDIDARCAQLRFADPRISIVVGDANAQATFDRIVALSDGFDAIIDDGSHLAHSIVASFVRYFPRVRPGGVYVIEDLHAAYYANFGGGIHNPANPMRFFALLADLVNYEHWQRDLTPEKLMAGFFAEMEFPAFLREGWIDAVLFFNSLVAVRRAATPGNGKLGRRVIVGETALVAPNVLR